MYNDKLAKTGPTLTWVRVVDPTGRSRMEARWATAAPAYARPAAA